MDATESPSIEEYDVEQVKQTDPRVAETAIEGRTRDWLVSFVPEPGAETLPPNVIHFPPNRTVRVYEMPDDRIGEYVLVTCLPRAGGGGPNGLHIDRAVRFSGDVLEMLDYTIRTMDGADWSGGIKRLADIRTRNGLEHVDEFLHAVSEMLEDAADERYAMDEWEKYMGAEGKSPS